MLFFAGLQQTSEPGKHSLFPEVPKSNVESDASIYSCLSQIYLQRLWQGHRPSYQTMGVSLLSGLGKVLSLASQKVIETMLPAGLSGAWIPLTLDSAYV